jgi:hypothetical protein
MLFSRTVDSIPKESQSWARSLIIVFAIRALVYYNGHGQSSNDCKTDSVDTQRLTNAWPTKSLKFNNSMLSLDMN